LAWFDAAISPKPQAVDRPKLDARLERRAKSRRRVDGYTLVKKALALRAQTRRWNLPLR